MSTRRVQTEKNQYKQTNIRAADDCNRSEKNPTAKERQMPHGIHMSSSEIMFFLNQWRRKKNSKWKHIYFGVIRAD